MPEIPDKRLNEICKIGQQEKCCRYIIADPEEGVVCGKTRPIKVVIDSRADSMTAKGDNCEGWL